MAVNLTKAFRQRGHLVSLDLGFGKRGFINQLPQTHRFMPTDNVAVRKLLYPVWLIAANCAALRTLFTGQSVWVNSIFALPAVLPMLLAPRRLVVHVHEADLPMVMAWTLRLAMLRGATLVAVSQMHADMLGVECTILPNAVGEVPPAVTGTRDRLVFIGSPRPLKGFDLFIAVVEALGSTTLRPVAYIARIDGPADAARVAQARAIGISVVEGETDPSVMLADGWLALQLTDPELWTETFSLTAAEAVWHLVPVGAAGAAVIDEVAAGAVAFNEQSRNAGKIAAHIRSLLDDDVGYAALVEGCVARRDDYRHDRFADRAEAILVGSRRRTDG